MLDARIPVALGASLLLHGAALALIERVPRGWQPAPPESSQWSATALQVRVLSSRSGDAAAAAVAPGHAAARAARLRVDAGARDSLSPAPGVVAPPRYLPADELDERPLIRSHVETVFPPFAPVAGGRVVLRLLINEAGTVVEGVVVRADPAGVFDAAAVDAFATARFTPGRKHGVAVKSALTIELRFGEAMPIPAQVREPEGPLFQPTRRARSNRNLRAQE